MDIWKRLPTFKVFQTGFPTSMSNSIKIQGFQVPRIQNQLNLTQFGSLNFNSNFVPNFEKTSISKFVPYSIIYTSIFYLKIFEQLKSTYDQFKFKSF
jgi:hypothetical protein